MSRAATINFVLTGVMAGTRPAPDPRRLSADALPRTRRCPPPVEDDTGETLWLLAWVCVFTIVMWDPLGVLTVFA